MEENKHDGCKALDYEGYIKDIIWIRVVENDKWHMDIMVL